MLNSSNSHARECGKPSVGRHGASAPLSISCRDEGVHARNIAFFVSQRHGRITPKKKNCRERQWAWDGQGTSIPVREICAFLSHSASPAYAYVCAVTVSAETPPEGVVYVRACVKCVRVSLIVYACSHRFAVYRPGARVGEGRRYRA